MIPGHLKPHIVYDDFDGEWVCQASLICMLVNFGKYRLAREFVERLNSK